MDTYFIELIYRENACVVKVTTQWAIKSKENTVDSTTYPNKRKACESIIYRFNDLDFESESLIFNGNKADSFLELKKLMDNELIDEQNLVSETM